MTPANGHTPVGILTPIKLFYLNPILLKFTKGTVHAIVMSMILYEHTSGLDHNIMAGMLTEALRGGKNMAWILTSLKLWYACTRQAESTIQTGCISKPGEIFGHHSA